MGIQRSNQAAVEFFSRSKAAMVNELGQDAGAARTFEPMRAGFVGDHQTNIGPKFSSSDRIDDRLKIATLAGNKDAKFDRRARLKLDAHKDLKVINFARTPRYSLTWPQLPE